MYESRLSRQISLYHSGSAPSEAIGAGGDKASPPEGKKKLASSWDAKEAGAAEGTEADFLSNLGTAQNYNINVTHGNVLLLSFASTHTTPVFHSHLLYRGTGIDYGGRYMHATVSQSMAAVSHVEVTLSSYVSLLRQAKTASSSTTSSLGMSWVMSRI